MNDMPCFYSHLCPSWKFFTQK